MHIETANISIGRSARDRGADAAQPGLEGAVAALETFYCGFNSSRPELIGRSWAGGPEVQLNNPLGGILRGADAIRQLYERVLTGRARLWVEFFDVVVYSTAEVVVFAGRERGECALDGEVVKLSIRTSRVFAFFADEGWRQVHHHGSIDDPDALGAYQQLIARSKS
ncbi:MAG: nuclear transport factor 2 family protein [Acidobacteria bacterium]|nr:nuclear transport factor 2 family protein [Acidobacteriota bacterium]